MWPITSAAAVTQGEEFRAHHGSVAARSASSATTAWRGRTPEGSVLLVRGQAVFGVGDPPRREAHEPFHELGRRAWSFLLVQDRGVRGGSFGDVFPSGDGVGVSPPAVKMSSIRANRVSDSFQLAGEPCGPCRARSIT